MSGKWDVFGRTADAVTIVAAIVSFVALFLSAPIQQVILASSLSALTIASVAMAWIQSKQLHEAAAATVRGERVITALPAFSNAVDDLKRGYYEFAARGQGNAEAAAQGFVNRCEAACTGAAGALQTLTGHECRVTLQELYYPESAGRARTSGAVRTIASSDRTAPTGTGTTDWVDENTDFASLVAGSDYFHSDDLRVDLQEGYRNSHWTPDKLREWKSTGKYPYLSTIVWPVRVRVDGSHAWTMAGFLSADSKDTEAFDLGVMRHLGAAWASVAYTGLSLYGSIKDAQESNARHEET